ncbi:hypothetical protein DN752_11775 [Echinicola strongylocentroti]|uniref:Outer membrane protein beta-barrel domain-containing protein n=1 Tax=Echinicola strongylocentroti TaxID=1795355 RepID=A0A2Z4IJ56_9BACT|nr:hypothetical protein [Echinicola strongylocentroti]AWW30747.1 hypothetical protein DN752_11775 [Echinicola strongylocentroti]
MKRGLILTLLIISVFDIALFAQDSTSQEKIYFTDFYISAGYRNQPYTELNNYLSGQGYQTFEKQTATLGGGISYVAMSRLGIFAEADFNLNKKRFSNDYVNYRYLPVHVTAGLQYHWKNSLTKDWRFYPKVGIYYGTTSLDLIAKDLESDFNENLMGNMNTSFLYQRNLGLNFSLNADKLLGAFLKPTTQVGVYSRMGLQVGYMLNLYSSVTKLRRNFSADLRKDLIISNAPAFDPSAFYVKLNFAIGKFEKSSD